MQITFRSLNYPVLKISPEFKASFFDALSNCPHQPLLESCFHSFFTVDALPNTMQVTPLNTLTGSVEAVDPVVAGAFTFANPLIAFETTLETLDIRKQPLHQAEFTTAAATLIELLKPGSPLYNTLAKDVQKSKCVWSFAFETYSDDLSILCKNHPSVIKEILTFFNFTLNNPLSVEQALNVLNTPKLNDQETLFAIISIIQQQRVQNSPMNPLGADTTNELYLTLLDKKICELRAIQEYFSEWLLAEKKPRICPCYTVAKDADTIQIFISQAQFDSKGTLLGFYADSDESAEKKLHELCKMRRTTVEDKDKSITISQTHFETLNAHVQQAKQKLSFLIFERVTPPSLPRPHQISSPETDDDTSSDAEASGQKDKKTALNQQEIPSRPKHRQLARSEPKLPTGFTTLTDSDCLLAAAPNLSSSLPGKHLKIGAALDLSNEAVLPMQSFDDLWDSIARRETQATLFEVKKAASKMLLFQIKPLEHPIIEAFKTMPEQKDKFPVLNRLMKPYQVEEAKFLTHLAEHGIAGVEALEMGLGKTLIYLECITNAMQKKPDTKHMIVLRKSIAHSVKSDVVKFFNESKRTAWNVLLRKFPSADLYKRFLQTLLSTLEKPRNSLDPEIDGILSLCHYIPFETLQQRMQLLIGSGAINNTVLQATLFQALKNHLENIQAQDKRKEEFLTRFKSAYELVKKSSDPHVENIKRWLVTRSDPYAQDFQTLMQPFDPNRPLLLQQHLAPYISYLFQVTAIILNYTPQKLSIDLDSGYVQQGLEQIVRFDTEKDIIIATDSKILKEALERKAATLIITTTGAIKKTKELVSTELQGMLVIDEAQDYKKQKTQSHKLLQDVIQARKTHRKDHCPQTIVVSATPYENRLLELFNLCSLANKDYFPNSTFMALQAVTNNAIYEVMKEPKGSDDQKLERSVCHLYAQMQVFLRSLKLVRSLKMQDERVIRSWQGQVPKKDVTHHDTSSKITEKAKEILQKIEEGNIDKKPLTQALLLAQKHQILSALTHPEWTEDRLNAESNPVIAAHLQLFKEGKDLDGMHAWIAESSLVSALFESTEFTSAVKNKEKTIIFVEHTATGDLLKWALTHLKGLRTSFYSGLNPQEHPKLISSFKKGDTDVFIATTKSGGAGLNLNEAIHTFFLVKEWNPAIIIQAEARSVRIGQDNKTHYMHHFHFGTFFEMRHSAIVHEKEMLRRFVDDPSFCNFTRYLGGCAYHQLYNQMQDPQKIDANYQLIQARLEELIKSVSQEALDQLVLQVTPKIEAKDEEKKPSTGLEVAHLVNSLSSIVGSRPLCQKIIIPVRVNHCKRRAIALGIMAQKNPEKFTQLKELLQSNNSERLFHARNGSLRQAETLKLDPQITLLDNALAKIIYEADQLGEHPDVSIRTFEQTENGQLLLVQDVSQENCVELLRSMVKINGKPQEHWDLVL